MSNGDYTIPGLDTLEELANKHYPTHTGKKDTVYPEVSITKVELETRYNDWISEERIITAFKGFESKKSPGPDGIKPIALKHLPQSMIKSIKMIYKVESKDKKLQVIKTPMPGAVTKKEIDNAIRTHKALL